MELNRLKRMAQPHCWEDCSEHKEDDYEFETTSLDEISVPPSELKLEHMLENKLMLDAVDMGTLPGADFKAWNELRRSTGGGGDFIIGEAISPRSSVLGLSMTRTDSQRSLLSLHDHMNTPARGGRGSVLGLSASMEKFDELSYHVPFSPRLDRRSSNLSQMISTLKKSPSMDLTRGIAREDPNGNSPPPPPPKSELTTNLLGPRRHSNLAVMRVIAESV